MTTIAANRKVMASDSLVTGGVPMCHCDKVFRIRDSLVGVCGDNAFTTKWLEWFRREMPPVEELMDISEEKNFLAMELNAKGLWMYTNTCEPDALHDKFYAIGSGSHAAMAAMHLGKSPSEAVRIAAMCDEATGGKTREMSLLPPHKERAVKKEKKPVPDKEVTV
jgi:ATP-dependent protease HslVU (ClpYQ) peptidase subunit